jgi:YD repeat-containing protein
MVLLAGTAAAITASADPVLRNVIGFDPALLAGKTCQGVFNTGKRREGSQGALQVRFAVDGDVLAAHLWRRLGKSAYDRAAYAITQPGQSVDATRFDDLGEVRGITVTGSTIRYVDPTGAKVQLTYDRGRLVGQSDPRGGTDWRMTRVAIVKLVCR